MRPGSSRLWISVFLLVASTVIALPDDPKVGARPAAKVSVVQTKESQAAKALDALKEGNKRFRAGTSVQKNLLAKVKASAAGQYPFAVVLGCMDSRVPAEAVFDQSIGDLFLHHEDHPIEFVCLLDGALTFAAAHGSGNESQLTHDRARPDARRQGRRPVRRL